MSPGEGDGLLSLAARLGALGVVDLLLREGTPPDAFGIWPGALVEALEVVRDEHTAHHGS